MKQLLSIVAYLIGAGSLINEVRGLIMAGPVLYGLWLTGGTMTAIIIAISSLLGIALSVAVPMWAAKRIKAYAQA